jgi:hypothetical protein
MLGLATANNVYSYPTNPTNYVDPSGLYVDVLFDVTAGKITVSDYGWDSRNKVWDSAPKSVTTFNVFSGGNINKPSQTMNNPNFEYLRDVGPIPKGDYYIGEMQLVNRPELNGDKGWFPVLNQATLRSSFEVFNPQTKQMVTRDDFHFHPGLISDGCVTFKSETRKGDEAGYPKSMDYTRFSNILNATKPFDVWVGFRKKSIVGFLRVR